MKLFWLSIFATLLFVGCSEHNQSIGSGYYLHELEDGSFLLMREGSDSPNGYIEGVVLKISKKSHELAVFRRSAYLKNGFREEPDAWFVINTDTHEINGPITPSLFAEKFPHLEEIATAP